jgi:hypothetical protein
MAHALARPSETQDDDPAVGLAVEMLRRALDGVPEHLRPQVAAKLSALLKPKPPLRGKDTLNNVVALFRQEKKWRASDMVEALADTGAEPKQIYNALNYLRSRRIIQKRGYGIYVLEDGSLIEGPP